MKIAVIGTGGVGQTLASKFISLGHQVMIGTRNMAEKLSSHASEGSGNPHFADWLRQNQHIKLGTFAEAAAFGELIVNAANGSNSMQALNLADAKNLNGKILIDVANPLDFSKGMPPSLIPALSNTHSLGEEIQNSFPQAMVVKTLNTMWAGLMVYPAMINNGNHINFMCGNDSGAKQTVRSLLNEFGWKNNNIIDLGDITAARGSEAILLIWLRIRGVNQGGAFNFNIVS